MPPPLAPGHSHFLSAYVSTDEMANAWGGCEMERAGRAPTYCPSFAIYSESQGSSSPSL